MSTQASTPDGSSARPAIDETLVEGRLPAGSAAGGQRPSFEEFRQLAAHHTVVPVWRELLGDLETPVAAFRKLGGSEGSVLLESVERGERWGRYSFLGTDPFATFIARDGKVTWSGDLPDGLFSGTDREPRDTFEAAAVAAESVAAESVAAESVVAEPVAAGAGATERGIATAAGSAAGTATEPGAEAGSAASAGDPQVGAHGSRSAPIAGLPDGPPLAVLRAALARLRSPAIPGLPPLFAGAIGYLAWDVVRELERLPDTTEDDLGLPDAALVFPRSVVVFDHLAQRLVLVANALVGEATDLAAAYADAEARLDRLTEGLAAPTATQPTLLPVAGPPAAATSDLAPGRYQEMVETAKEYIRAGDIFQVVPSQRFSINTSADPFDVYRVLRVVNPSPYMYFLRLPGVTIAGSSPEVLVTVRGRQAALRPIAGTRPRGADQAADLKLESELLADAKERAEHVMLVDLARNDLGRVCVPGSVQVHDFMTVERYSHVMHIVSQVTGELAEGVGALDVLAACFPAGTVSGSPKVRAMEIIDELERHRRGPYAGAVGYFDFSGNLDTCITIRTLLFTGDAAYCQAGAGIVADSVPELEERETEAKARALLAAVAAAEAMPGMGVAR